MSEENVAVVRDTYDHLSRTGDPDPKHFAGDAAFDGSRLPGFGIYKGLDEFLAAWHSYRNAFDEWRTEIEEVLDGQGDRVFAAVRDGGRLKSSAGEVRNVFFHVWEFQSGRIVGWTVFLDRREALEAAGLQE